MVSATSSTAACWCCCIFIITIVVVVTFLWPTLLVKQSRLYTDYIYVPALIKSIHSPLNNTVFFTLKLVNRNMDRVVQYDEVRLASCARKHPGCYPALCFWLVAAAALIAHNAPGW